MVMRCTKGSMSMAVRMGMGDGLAMMAHTTRENGKKMVAMAKVNMLQAMALSMRGGGNMVFSKAEFKVKINFMNKHFTSKPFKNPQFRNANYPIMCD